MKIYLEGAICCDGGNELASDFDQNSPHKICLHTNPLTYFVVPIEPYRGTVFHPFFHQFVCPLILQHLREH